MSISSSPAVVPACCIAGAECDTWALGSASKREERGPWQEVTARDVTFLDGKVVPGSLSVVLLRPYMSFSPLFL